MRSVPRCFPPQGPDWRSDGLVLISVWNAWKGSKERNITGINHTFVTVSWHQPSWKQTPWGKIAFARLFWPISRPVHLAEILIRRRIRDSWFRWGHRNAGKGMFAEPVLCRESSEGGFCCFPTPETQALWHQVYFAFCWSKNEMSENSFPKTVHFTARSWVLSGAIFIRIRKHTEAYWYWIWTRHQNLNSGDTVCWLQFIISWADSLDLVKTTLQSLNLQWRDYDFRQDGNAEICGVNIALTYS